MNGTELLGGWRWLVAGATDSVLAPARRPSPPSRTRVWLLVGAACLIWIVLVFQYQESDARLPEVAAALVAAAVPALAVFGPVWAWRLVCVGILAGLPRDSTPDSLAAFPFVTMLVAAVVLYVVAVTVDRRTAVGAWLLVSGALALDIVVGDVARDAGVAGAIGPAMVLTGLLALPVALGDGIRDRGATRSRLRSAREEQVAGLTREAVLRERTHIARELHDVVAHHMSMIALQSEATLLRHPDLPAEASQRLTAIRDASRQGLGEMRRLVAVLRDDGPVDRAPQPGTAQVPDLVAEARRWGMDVTYDAASGTPGDPTRRPVPASIDVTVYRLVQEALSNARRHAPGARVTVSLEAGERDLRVRVVDDGGRSAHV